MSSDAPVADIVIKAEHLGKKYVIGHQGKRTYVALRDVVMQNARTVMRKTRDVLQGKPLVYGDETEEVWPLKDVSFEIPRGQAVGIIGRNGAGKSTLLKVLSRITEPSAGRVVIKGRVVSLLEVGTGFHPELTGRENVFLNGSVLGMTRSEIKRKFDEIVAFAEVDQYLDTPVKRYSSGMYVRLAFAVAAHLEPEILLVDEVLAVGDLAFQKKCLGKMEGVAEEGRTVLFVSHNMGSIRKLCDRAIWLHGGEIVQTGPAAVVTKAYEDGQADLLKESFHTVDRGGAADGRSSLHCRRVSMLGPEGESSTAFRYGDTLVLMVELAGDLAGGQQYSQEFRLYNELDQMVAVGASGPFHGKFFDNRVRSLRITIGPLTITSGKYRLALSLVADRVRIDTWDNAIGFTITDCQPFATIWDMPAATEGACVLQQEFAELTT